MAPKARKWSETGADILRGVAGGSIIGLPLIYTMEIWFIGMYVSDWYIVGFIALAFLINTGLNQASGFRPRSDLASDMIDSLTAIGLSAILSAIYLALIGTIRSGISFAVDVSMISFVAIPISIGFSIANTQFGSKTRTGGDWKQNQPGPSGGGEEKRKAEVDIRDIGITIAGATVLVFGIAPTREVTLVATNTNGYYWAGLVVLSLLLTYSMVFLADFSQRKRRRAYQGLLQQPIPETILAYSFSVLTGLLLMYLLGRTDVFSSLSYIVANAAVIGLPASVGGAAGRLIV